MQKKCTKKIVTALVTLLVTLTATLTPVIPSNAQETGPTSNYELVKEMGLGYNLAKTFAQTLDENLHIEKIKKRIDAAYVAGFHTIRIPVQWTKHMDAYGHIIQDEQVLLLKETVRYCMEKELYVILGSMGDLGEFSASRWDLPDVGTNKFQTEYQNMWTDISKMFETYNYHLVFEAYNEVKNNNEDVSGYGYDYKSNYAGRADSYYFAGRCRNLINMVNLNKIFAGIMKKVAPNRYYMISSYNADPRSAYSDYTNMTWENRTDHYINGSWNNTWYTLKGVDLSKAVYNCHIYKYGNDFVNEIKTLKNAFQKRNIHIPIYVDENGTHTSNLGTSNVNSNYVTPVSFMANDMASGLCLWDDTQSMSYLNKKTYEWYNASLIHAMIQAAGQESRPLEKEIRITVKFTGMEGDAEKSLSVPKGTAFCDLAKDILSEDTYRNFTENMVEENGGMRYSKVEESAPYSYKGQELVYSVDAAWDTVFHEDSTIQIRCSKENCALAYIHVCNGEQGECSKEKDRIAYFAVKAGTAAPEVIRQVYKRLGENLPAKDGYALQGFYQEGTRPFFLYQDSGRTANGYVVLYAKFVS